ncbi:MAG: thymidine kinase, partial [Candidatus Hadarchaeales archaeon]
GKTEELIRLITRARIAKKEVIAFKHSLDTQRAGTVFLKSHSGIQYPAIAVNKASDILDELKKRHFQVDVVAVDEAQFFSRKDAPNLVEVVFEIVNRGITIIISGLDTDFRGLPFGLMPELLAIADKVQKLTAICMVCGKEATLTQRLINGNPAPFSAPTIVVGAEEIYRAVCRDCHFVPGFPKILYTS